MSIHHTYSGERHPARKLGRLKLALALTFVYMLAEAAGGWLTNSLALIADAGHMLTDVAALSLTLAAGLIVWAISRSVFAIG